jgi:hypothetical protein
MSHHFPGGHPIRRSVQLPPAVVVDQQHGGRKFAAFFAPSAVVLSLAEGLTTTQPPTQPPNQIKLSQYVQRRIASNGRLVTRSFGCDPSPLAKLCLQELD